MFVITVWARAGLTNVCYYCLGKGWANQCLLLLHSVDNSQSHSHWSKEEMTRKTGGSKKGNVGIIHGIDIVYSGPCGSLVEHWNKSNYSNPLLCIRQKGIHGEMLNFNVCLVFCFHILQMAWNLLEPVSITALWCMLFPDLYTLFFDTKRIQMTLLTFLSYCLKAETLALLVTCVGLPHEINY